MSQYLISLLKRARFSFSKPTLDPSAQDQLQEDAANLIKTADALRDDGHAAEAAAAYRAMLALAPDRTDVQVQLGNMLKDSGKFAEAEQTYRAALARSDQADTHLQLGHVLKALGNRSDSLAEYRRALEIDPTTAGAIQELAEAGHPEQQEARFEAQLRGGGVEVLLGLSQAIAGMRAELDRLSRSLPEALSQTAFPTALYGTFRDTFPIPAPPIASGGSGTVFHIVLLAEREEISTLFAQVGAIQAQSWLDWNLTVLGHTSVRQRVIECAAVADSRIHWVMTEEGDGFAKHEQRHRSAEGWTVLLAPGVIFDQQALAWFAQAAMWSSASAFICDEETGTRQRGRIVYASPILRQVVDYDTLLESNVFGETIAVLGSTYNVLLPTLPSTSITAARTALLLKLSSNGQVGHVPFPLVWRNKPQLQVASDHEDGVTAYLAHAATHVSLDRKRGIPPVWRAQHPDDHLAVIIPTRDNASDLQTMVTSLLRSAAAPQTLEIIVVDNGSSIPGNVRILRDLEERGEARVLRRDEPFNWSNLNNQAVQQTEAPLLVFANDDMRMVSAGWDTRLRGLLERPDVGAVGARLLYPDDTVQHAGVLFGWKGSVIHDGLFESAGAKGPASRWQVTRAVGAVTGAFLATTRRNFLDLGGFDAQRLPVAYSDIDYALKLRAVGLRVLWTPAITLYHHESKTRKVDHIGLWQAARNVQEQATMDDRWQNTMDIEPSMHPFWHAATLPFRLMAPPTLDRVCEHIVRSGSKMPWIA